MTIGRSNCAFGSSRYCSIWRAARSASTLAGAFCGVDGCRYLIPVTTSPCVVTATFILGNSMMASYIALFNVVLTAFSSRLLRELLDLREELVRDLDTLRARALLGCEAARAGQTHFRVGKHRVHYRLNALQVLRAPGERAGID